VATVDDEEDLLRSVHQIGLGDAQIAQVRPTMAACCSKIARKVGGEGREAEGAFGSGDVGAG
jgi:hypothetical protein